MPHPPSPWCRACGEPAEREDVECGPCGTPLTSPAAGSALVGRVVVVPGTLLRTHGLAIGELEGTVSILGRGDEPRRIPRAQFDGLDTVRVPHAGVLGEAGRLWAAKQARDRRDIKGRWPDAAIDTAARAAADVDLGSRRAAAVDAVLLGLDPEAERLQLPPSELSWYRARAAVARQRADVEAMLGHLEALPRKGYPARTVLLLRCAGELQRVPQWSVRARTLLEPLRENDPDAAALYHALDAEPPEAAVAMLVPYAERVTGGDGTDLVPVARAVTELRRLPALPPVPTPTLAAFDARLAGLEGWGLDEAVATLAPLPPLLIDELVASGALTRVPTGGLSPTVMSFLRCRLDPGAAGEAELLEFDHVAEVARRHYRERDGDALAALAEPDGDAVAAAAVAHYRALHAYVAKGALDVDALRPDVHELLATTEKLRAGGGTVPVAVAEDPTVWQRLGRTATSGSLRLEPEVRRRHPAFAAWLDLLGIQRSVFDRRWDDVLPRARVVRAASVSERLRDEGLNLMAYAQWNLGNRDDALELLDEAVAGDFTPALLVNAALVASEHGSVAAVPYLARLFRVSDDPVLRRTAVLRAISVWLTDESAPGCPPALRDLVREAVGRPWEDEGLLRTIVTFAVTFDPEWFGDANPPAADPAAALYLEFQRLLARTRSERHTESLTDVATVLGTLWQRSPIPDWVVEERDRVTARLMDHVHQRFGDAADAAPAIAALLDGGVLEPYERFVLAAQAGGHLATHADELDSCITPEAEQRFLFETREAFQATSDQLTEAQRTAVAEELLRCLIVAALGVSSAMQRERDRFTDAWNAAIEAERYAAPAHREGLRASRRRMHAQAQPWPRRCLRYADSVAGLPLGEAQATLMAEVRQQAQDFTRELARLRGLV